MASAAGPRPSGGRRVRVAGRLGGGALPIAELELLMHRPLEEAEARAILALPALRRLRISSPLPFDYSLRPFEVLRGLRPEVAVKVSPRPELPDGRPLPPKAAEAVAAAVHSIFAGRPPL
eukprot:tig00000147_g9478.t1